MVNVNGWLTPIFIVVSSRAAEICCQISVTPIDNLVTQSDKCIPDVANLLDIDVSNIPVAFLTCAAEVFALTNQTHPDVGKTTDEIITSYGYPVEIHSVATDDGYILTVQQIPRPGSTSVYLQHGLGGCSDNWVLMSKQSLAFILADAGYDVWLGNFRGTTYSLGHKTLNWNDPNNFTFWNFSWHEMGKYDVPAVINHIKSVNVGVSKVFYIGHSMGTTAFLVGLDQVPETLNENVAAAILLAPAGLIGHSSSPLRLIAPLATKLDPIFLETVLKGRIESPDELLKLMNTSLADICTPTAVRCTACAYLIFALFGMDAPQMNYTNLVNVADKIPNTMSVKTLYHYAQSLDKCTFKQFDYGPAKNNGIYGSSTPPDYNFAKTDIPIYSFYANFDNLVRPKDVKKTLALLPEGVLQKNTKVEEKYFNHVDFLIAKDADKLLYSKILNIMTKIQLAQ